MAARPAHKATLPLVVDEKAAAVLAGARTVFLSHGFSAATTDMIQQAAGVSKATVYARYRTKEALFAAVIEAECSAFLTVIRETGAPSTHLRDVLHSLAHGYLQIVLAPSALALFRAVVGEAPRFPALARQFFLAGPSEFASIVAHHLDEAAAHGDVDFSSVGRDAAASVFANLVRGEAQMQCLTHPGSIPSQAQCDHWASVAVTTFVRAFGRKPGSAPADASAPKRTVNAPTKRARSAR